MKRILLILALCLLTNLLSFSQTNYPIKLKIGNDTIVGITINQLKEVNKKFVYIDFLENKVDLLNKKVDETLLLSLQKDSLISSKNDVISELITLNNNSIEDIELQNKKITSLTEERDKFKKKSNTFFKTTIGACILIVLIVI